MKSVIIISTGNELTSGQVVDTNSSFISDRLYKTTFQVQYHLVIGDDRRKLKSAILSSLDNSDIIIITGGLGPTDDDNTIEVLKEIIGFIVKVDEGAYDKMKSFFEALDIEVKENDLKMVEVPVDSDILDNSRGLAPGFILNFEEKIIVALPGVPGEMSVMFDEEVMPRFAKMPGFKEISSLKFNIVGMKESEINETVKTHVELSSSLTWGIRAHNGVTSVTFLDQEGDHHGLKGIDSAMKGAFGEKLLNGIFSSPEEELIDRLKELNKTISVAESCTGGIISGRLTDVPGASEVFAGSIVAYDNSVKVELLGVGDHTLRDHGAVSEETAAEMAVGIKNRLGTDIGISTTGIAGPGGGTDKKPVGTVCFGFAYKNDNTTFTIHFKGDRERVRKFASLYAIEYMRRYFKSQSD